MQKSGFLRPLAFRPSPSTSVATVPVIVPHGETTYFEEPRPSGMVISESIDYEEALSANVGGCGNKGCPCGPSCTCGKHCTCAQVAAMEKCSTNADLDVHLERFPMASQANVEVKKKATSAEVLEIPREALFAKK